MTPPVIIPCLNEGGNIGRVVRVFRMQGLITVVAVDAETTDDTVQVATRAGAGIYRSSFHGKGEVVSDVLRTAYPGYRGDVIFCDGDVTITDLAVEYLTRPLARQVGQRVIVPEYPTPAEVAAAETAAKTRFDIASSWQMVSGIRRVKMPLVPGELYGYLMETQINLTVQAAGQLSNRLHISGVRSPFVLTEQRLADMKKYRQIGREKRILK